MKFSNTNKEYKSLAEIRYQAYDFGFEVGYEYAISIHSQYIRADERAKIYNAIAELINLDEEEKQEMISQITERMEKIC